MRMIAKKRDFSWYKDKVFLDYVDKYAEFVHKHKKGLDFYVTVDVIFNPEQSWEILKYLEREWGLNPLPVIHYGTDLKWFNRHIDAGYDFIGIGGLGQETHKGDYFEWADRVFNYLCPRPSRLPIVKCHGFAMTAWELLVRYPWWSVDSASWIKAGAFGSLYIPKKTKGEYDFTGKPPWVVAISDGSSAIQKGIHYQSYKQRNKPLAKIMEEWVEYLGMPYGKTDNCGDSIEWGVFSDFTARSVANACYFEMLSKALPEWPWSFDRRVVSRGFNISL